MAVSILSFWTRFRNFIFLFVPIFFFFLQIINKFSTVFFKEEEVEEEEEEQQDPPPTYTHLYHINGISASCCSLSKR
jgi:Na+-transporting methylmalonyl-CoA/oxaloacetate decarboxylase gamma subunit